MGWPDAYTRITGGVDTPIGGLGGTILLDNQKGSNGNAFGISLSLGPAIDAPVSAESITCESQKWCKTL